MGKALKNCDDYFGSHFNSSDPILNCRKWNRISRKNWEVLKATAVISKEQLEARMNAPVPFEPQSFWLV